MRAAVLLVVACAGCFADSPYGSPTVISMGTLATGEVFIELLQPWQHDDGIITHGQLLVVDPEGPPQQVHSMPALLAPDCSDQPAALGPCIPPMMTGQPPIRSYPLPDGGSIQVTPDPQQAARVAADGTVVWTVPVSGVWDAVRDGAMLVSTDAGSIAVHLGIDTGRATWSLHVPGNI